MSKAVKTAKEKAAKKISEGKSERGIKYSDKSIGQPELVPIYEELKKLLLPYEKGYLKAMQAAGQYHLISNKEVEIAGRKRNDIYFTSLLVQKGYDQVKDVAKLVIQNTDTLRKFLVTNNFFPRKKMDTSIKSKWLSVCRAN